jgi:hypothetical protein
MHTGFIYQIVADNTDKVYYGSTSRKLKYRFSNHKSLSNHNCSSRELFNYPNTRIELIETCIKDDKKLLKRELNEIEREYIERSNQIKPNTCINKVIPTRTKTEYMKNYSITNKKQIDIKNINYYAKNKEAVLKNNAEYQEKNKERIKQQKKDYHEKNKERINKSRRLKAKLIREQNALIDSSSQTAVETI